MLYKREGNSKSSKLAMGCRGNKWLQQCNSHYSVPELQVFKLEKKSKDVPVFFTYKAIYLYTSLYKHICIEMSTLTFV